MVEYYKKVVLENYANFSGRARRSEFWYFVLLNGLISFVFGFVDGMIGMKFGQVDGQGGIGLLQSVYGLAVLVPGLAVAVRRLHDIGKSGWSLLIVLIPLVGAIILIVWYAKEGVSGTNDYGQDPKNSSLDTEDHLLDD